MVSNVNARRARWAVPVAVVATAGIVAGGVALAGEDAPGPLQSTAAELPDKDAEELLDDIANAEIDPFSGTVVQTSRLGLPELPDLGRGPSASLPLRMLSGSNTARIWFSSDEEFRFSLLGESDEVTLIRDGSDVWLWSSETNEAHHLDLPAGLPLPGARATGTPHPDPQFSAEKLLAAADPSTEVTVDGTVEVAGRPAYELAVRPRDEGSLVEEIVIAVDGETSRVLQVEVIADGMEVPAFEIGFTSISFDEPSDEVYRFNPPPEATVTEHDLMDLARNFAGHGGRDRATGDGRMRAAGPLRGGELTVIGEGWTSVLVLDEFPRPDGSPDSSDEDGAALDALIAEGEPVSGDYGSGRLYETSLVSALWLDDGTLLVGAVTPEVLEKAATEAG